MKLCYEYGQVVRDQAQKHFMAKKPLLPNILRVYCTRYHLRMAIEFFGSMRYA